LQQWEIFSGLYRRLKNGSTCITSGFLVDSKSKISLFCF
jgi:hypothetical protein